VKHPARTVIITGASAGVGRAIAERFAREGDRVGLIARDETALKDVQRELQASGASAVEWEAADVSNAAAVFAAADQLERRLGYVDIMDQRRHGNRFLDRGGHQSSGISTSDRGHLSWLRVWHHGGVEIDAATSARSHHPDRVRAGLSRHSPAGGLLRR